MGKFYFILWFRWALRITLCSVISAAALSSVAVVVTFISYGMPAPSAELLRALYDIFEFWFILFWPMGLLLALFRSLKYIFNVCMGGYELKLLTCDSAETIETIGYKDLIKVWRKWLMLNIWLIGSFMVVAVFITNVFLSFKGIFEWFNIYWLYSFILVSGYLSFIVMSAKCKKVKVVRC